MRRKTEESSFGQLVKTNGVGGQCVHKDQVLILMIENSSTGHLLYTNRWNLHKARDWKASPSAVHTGWDLFYSLRWAGTKWMVARKGRAQFRAQFSDPKQFSRRKSARFQKGMTTWLPLLLRSHLIWSCHRQDLKSRPLVRCFDLCNTSPHNCWPTKALSVTHSRARHKVGLDYQMWKAFLI